MLLKKALTAPGSGPQFLVVDPGVHYRGPLPSPILKVQELCIALGKTKNHNPKDHQRAIELNKHSALLILSQL